MTKFSEFNKRIIAMFKEFKKFIARGNVMDLAVGVIIGGAFGAIVSSLVGDIIMPLVGLLTGKVNFANMFILLGKAPDGIVITTAEQAKEANVPILSYGAFITAVLNFVIVAMVVFLVVKSINKLHDMTKKPTPPPAPTVRDCPFCFSSISIKATKCPHCVSEIPPEEKKEA